ncbi:MAG: plasmid mobilization protein [Candidatus Helarchaeota archaeon]
MEQINFRVSKDEKQVLKILAELKGVSVAEFVRQIVLKEINPIRIDLAFRLLAEGKISRKRAWLISGLTYHEFMLEWEKRRANELIPNIIREKELENALTIDLKRFLKDKLDKSKESVTEKY